MVAVIQPYFVSRKAIDTSNSRQCHCITIGNRKCSAIDGQSLGNANARFTLRALGTLWTAEGVHQLFGREVGVLLAEDVEGGGTLLTLFAFQRFKEVLFGALVALCNPDFVGGAAIVTLFSGISL